MGLNDYLAKFCKEHGYTYEIDYHEQSKEYSITLSNEKENAALLMSREELQSMSNQKIRDVLDFLHNGIQLRTKQGNKE